MFTTKFTKGSKDSAKPFVKKFAEGGAVDDDDRHEQALRALARQVPSKIWGQEYSDRVLDNYRKSDAAASSYISRKVRPDLKERD